MDERLIQKVVREVVRRLRALDGVMPTDATEPPVSLVTEELVAHAVAQGQRALHVMPRAIVTPLAQDLLRRGGIRLVETGGQVAAQTESVRSMAIAMGSDRRGDGLRRELLGMVRGIGRDAIEVSGALNDSYVQTAQAVAETVVEGNLVSGIVIDGGGAPSAIAANKVKGIRAVACHDVTSAKYARAHVDANVLCLGVGAVADTVAKEIVATWLTTPFEGGAFADRVREIEDLDR